MGLADVLKKVPVDLAQGSMREKTKGKKIAFDYIPDGANKQALDIGCREGSQSERLKSLGYDVTPVDMEPKYEEGITLDVNNSFPFEDNSFDLIWCSEVIEHLDNPESSINEMRRVCKPTGRIIITTPNSYAWFFRFAAFWGWTQQKIQNKGHQHFFHIKDIRKLFPRAQIFGYFPYMLFKAKIKTGLNFLTPTFVIIEDQS